MKGTLTIPILLGVLLVGPLVNAQVIIKSNDTSIRYDHIKSTHYIEKTSSFDLQGKPVIDYVSENVINADSVHKTVVFVKSFMWDIGKVYVDSSLYNEAGPVRYHFTTSTKTKNDSVIYHLNNVESHFTLKGKKVDKTIDMSPGYFDDSSVWSLIGYLTLKEGIKYQLNCFGSNNKIPLPMLVEYQFDEPAKMANGSVENLKVVRVEYDQSVFYLWIDPVTHICMKDIAKSAKGTFVTEVL